MIDDIARDRALNRHGIPLCQHVPIAAVDEAAIVDYIGGIRAVLSGGGLRRAFLVEADPPEPRDGEYPIWDDPRSAILHEPLQLRVHVRFTRYRRAWQRAFPDMPLAAAVLSHAMKRRIAALKGFDFVRITPTRRSANSSSAFTEG
jgi:hypothetical protein